MSTWVIFGYNISIMCSEKYTQSVATISRTVLHSLGTKVKSGHTFIQCTLSNRKLGVCLSYNLKFVSWSDLDINVCGLVPVTY